MDSVGQSLSIENWLISGDSAQNFFQDTYNIRKKQYTYKYGEKERFYINLFQSQDWGRLISMPLAEGSGEEEMPFIAEVIKGGRLTIPEEIRKLLRIEEGNYVLIRLKVVSRKRLGKKQRRSSPNGNGGT
jgi:hypothetical protein